MPERDFEHSTLWRVSEFDRVRSDTGGSGFARLNGTTLLPTTLLTDLRRLDASAHGDVLEVLAACLRHRESALLCLAYEELVWPVTVFPSEMLYHSPRDMAEASGNGLAHVRVLSCEPPGVRPPGHRMSERIAHPEHYRPLAPLLWQMALHGPRKTLLAEIGGHAAYRATLKASERLPAPGALGSAAERLRLEAVPLRDMARWPGLTHERASRLLNALYLASGLMVLRTHPMARDEPALASVSHAAAVLPRPRR